MKRDFLSLLDCSREELQAIIALAAELKRDLKAGRATPFLQGKAMAMIFEKPSLRTHVTFELGMFQLGGYPIYLTPSDIQLGQRETVADAARNLERFVDLIMARTFAHETLLELARCAQKPVINGLSDLLHPCQVLADCFTLFERGVNLETMRVAFIGDGNNMAHSWMNAAARFGFELVVACPAGYEPNASVTERARSAKARIEMTRDVVTAVSGADVLYTDTWASMGREAEADERRAAFARYQINADILRCAKPSAVVMHCLPAHRGEEIADEVMDGPQSIVFDQAENRLHAQKAVMVWLMRQTS